MRIYDPRDFVTFYDTIICEECADSELEQCRECGKQAHSHSIHLSDWYALIPYEADFDSYEERNEIISTLETTFYCNECHAKLSNSTEGSVVTEYPYAIVAKAMTL